MLFFCQSHKHAHLHKQAVFIGLKQTIPDGLNVTLEILCEQTTRRKKVREFLHRDSKCFAKAVESVCSFYKLTTSPRVHLGKERLVTKLESVTRSTGGR